MTAFSTPAVRVNDITIPIVPNSYKSVSGKGENNVRAASGGGDNVEVVTTSNAETKIGQIMFDVHSTPNNLALINSWKSQPGQNTVAAVESFPDGTSGNESMTSATLVNDPERQRSFDGIISLEWKGAPIIDS